MSPILREVPAEFETARLLIRCARPGDGQLVHEAVVETLTDLRKWPASLPWAMHDPSVEASEEFCRKSQVEYLARTGFPLLLFHKIDNRYVGGSGLHDVSWSVPSCEIGYWCRKSYQRQGLLTEAVIGITEFAFSALGMRRIVSLPDARNGASCRVAERAGYLLEGTLHQERKTPEGSLRDTCVYARTH
jgi:RimJ/RimL family protein N-acetyltransferase